MQLSITNFGKDEARKNFGRRSAIEPIISRVKSDFRLARNFLKGVVGDTLNLLLSAAAFNFQKMRNEFLKHQKSLLNLQKHIQTEKHKHTIEMNIKPIIKYEDIMKEKVEKD